ncbi:GNAT family N-acetyltransferase [Luteolibacter sp. SL250]|uniref:GNAT family N-acetyltransferase n=1 Tax=Luteolibacter sp. SL250 TaxID=2995170 RepID=UPI002270E236|nr:GNAT family N-acetyltransferase [Luteolibacter sp. SL250]WAC18951.1 GNAT family N-acetyltransferase [Luteolibacter sp. SL250]
MTGFQIVTAGEEHHAGLHAVTDAVAGERKYLAGVKVPPLESSVAYYRSLAKAGFPHLVAVDDGRVLGWCDVTPAFGDARAHVGTLGMGLLPAYRGKVHGRRMLEEAIRRSWDRGLTRLELTVRVDNANAIALYERLGFVMEGTKRAAIRIDGVYHDVLMMALVREE